MMSEQESVSARLAYCQLHAEAAKNRGAIDAGEYIALQGAFDGVVRLLRQREYLASMDLCRRVEAYCSAKGAL